MGLSLGIDGKKRAVNINIGISVSSVSTLYVGLLQAAPTGMDGMNLATLIGSGQGNEFAINANFYSARKAITVGGVTADANGAVVFNTGTAVNWANTSGSTVFVAGIFITDASSGSSGLVLWAGAPDAGTATITSGSSATLAANDIILKVD